MSEIEQLTEMNNQIRFVLVKLDRIDEALLGSPLVGDGYVKKQELIEKRLRRIETYISVLVGAFSLGTIPIGVKVLPLLKDYFR